VLPEQTLSITDDARQALESVRVDGMAQRLLLRAAQGVHAMYKTKLVTFALCSLFLAVTAHAGRVATNKVYITMKSGRLVEKPRGFDGFIERLGGDPGNAMSAAGIRKLAKTASPADRTLAKKLIKYLATEVHNQKIADQGGFNTHKLPDLDLSK
jgi:hypothetical protein